MFQEGACEYVRLDAQYASFQFLIIEISSRSCSPSLLREKKRILPPIPPPLHLMRIQISAYSYKLNWHKIRKPFVSIGSLYNTELLMNFGKCFGEHGVSGIRITTTPMVSSAYWDYSPNHEISPFKQMVRRHHLGLWSDDVASW